jgi:hypothetical protein
VGLDVIDFDAMKCVSHGDDQNANITNSAKEVHPCLVGGEGSQVIIAIVDHGFSYHQTSKVATNNDSLCRIVVPMSKLPIEQCMHSSQLQNVTQLARVFIEVATRLNFTIVMELSQFISNMTFNKLVMSPNLTKLIRFANMLAISRY